MSHCGQLNRLNYLVESPDEDLRIVRILDPVWTHDAHLLLAEVAAIGMARLEVDLSRVRKMCTAAFAELLILRQRLARHGCEMHLHGFQQQPWSLCCVLKLVKLLSQKDALESTAPAPPKTPQPLSDRRRRPGRDFRATSVYRSQGTQQALR